MDFSGAAKMRVTLRKAAFDCRGGTINEGFAGTLLDSVAATGYRLAASARGSAKAEN